MTINPTINGSLKIEFDDAREFMALEQIVIDARGDEDIPLSDDFADLVLDEDWQEFTAPEIEHLFEEQHTKLLGILKSAETENEVFITPETAETWYGTVNQARLQLEKQYKLSALKDNFSESLASNDLLTALRRDQFYLTVQSLILDYIWGE